MGAIDWTLLIAAMMAASTPILIAALGELVAEKSGVLNLGVEGMMITGAVCGFITAVTTGSALLGFVGGAVGGALLSLVFAFLTQFLLTNQVATGLALMPLALAIGQGAQLMQPLAIAVIGGFTLSGPIILFILPGLYRLLDPHGRLARVGR